MTVYDETGLTTKSTDIDKKITVEKFVRTVLEREGIKLYPYQIELLKRIVENKQNLYMFNSLNHCNKNMYIHCAVKYLHKKGIEI